MNSPLLRNDHRKLYGMHISQRSGAEDDEEAANGYHLSSAKERGTYLFANHCRLSQCGDLG